MQATDSRCGRCGKGVLAPAELRRGRVREHVRLLGILWMAYSALHAVVGVAALVAYAIFGHMVHIPNGPPPEIAVWIRPLLAIFGWLILAKAAVGFFTGWGLLQHEGWARVFALIVGFIALLNVPIGTVLGIYTLWVLLPAQSDYEYKALGLAA